MKKLCFLCIIATIASFSCSRKSEEGKVTRKQDINQQLKTRPSNTEAVKVVIVPITKWSYSGGRYAVLRFLMVEEKVFLSSINKGI